MGLGHILLELDRPGDTSLRGAGVGRSAPRMPETSSSPSFSLCSLSEPVGVLLACLPSRVFFEDRGLSSSGSPTLASFPNASSRSGPAEHLWRGCRLPFGLEAPLWYRAPSPLACFM